MVVAAFKSASGRATTSSSSPSSSSSSSLKQTEDNPTSPRKKVNSPKKPRPPRRSRSVSAVSRSQFETSSDFLIKRDNPLYWSNVSPPDEENKEYLTAKNKSLNADNNRRGRSVSRNTDVGKNVSKEIGRSLARVDTGRCRSVSRGPVARTHFFNSERDVEQKSISLGKYRNRNDLGRGSYVGRKSNLVRSSSSDTIKQIQSLQTPTRSSSANLASSRNLSCEDGVTASSFSEAEERTNRAICEQTKAIQRSHLTSIANTDVTDIPPDLVSPSAVELVLDIRREYANKLEQSQERARKLRADLAVEEHRGLELSRILKEVIPDPMMSDVQKSRPGRKSSIERRKMSKRLTEEAMAYFDECVSLSTFDSSDFSSQEDPPISVVGISAPVGDHVSLSQASTSVVANHDNCPNDRQAWYCIYSSSKEPTPDEISLNGSETQRDRSLQFSFADNQNDTLESQHDIGKFVKNFERGMERVDANSNIRGNLDDYNLQVSAQSCLFDMVLFKNKINSGTMLLCGGVTTMLSPFGS
ncbi:uncharacterized protein DDB_G0271670 [Ricinus communis]|uniref:Uncharacterized protein n=1 Tax=Ricinus communis TaxID=3988 RepID=B9SK03_RICCO|nr:uncharacterized protein DDB_G0271670 [Ricinus communis]EEF36058.1 conserved hypothetical protein [Ricinus communis]|eukprot:XP_002526322.1 uncharacterized protein DDB_G0271670 [Ricinus communis]